MAVAKEQICIRPFIHRVENQFQQGVKVREVLSEISGFQNRIRNSVENISPRGRFTHEIGTSTTVLAGIVIFEAGRNLLAQRGVHLPSSLDIFSHTLMAASLTPINMGSKKDSSLPSDIPEVAALLKKSGEKAPYIASIIDNVGGGVLSQEEVNRVGTRLMKKGGKVGILGQYFAGGFGTGDDALNKLDQAIKQYKTEHPEEGSGN